VKTLARSRDKAEVLARLQAVGPESRRRWGRMSAHQMICHLSDAFLVATGERAASSAAGPLQRTVVKWIALYAPLHWPAGILTRPEIDQAIDGTRPQDFRADVARLEALVEHFSTQSGRIERPHHPIFGRLSEAAWLRWAYLHMDHHLRQFGA
jgi:hypothetical protein